MLLTVKCSVVIAIQEKQLSLCPIKITVTAVTVIKTWRLPVTVRVVTCGFSLINAYMCVVANVYWVMTYVTLTVIFYMTYWCSGTTQN